MKRALYITIIFLSTSIYAVAQTRSDNLKEIFDDAEFFYALEEYKDALPEYMKMYKSGFEDNAYINYKIGICYSNIAGAVEKSIPYFKKATENLDPEIAEGHLRENKAPYDTYIYLGNNYRRTYQFEKAIAAYMKYLELDESGFDANFNYVKKEIEACKQAIEEMKTPIIIEKVNLGVPVNNGQSNFRAVVSGNQTRIAYMNSLPFYDAVYVSDKKNGTWTTPKNITPEIKSDGDQYTTALSYDGNTLLVTKEDEFDSDIFISEFEDGVWSRSKKISKEINSRFWESHASFSPDGKRLYFASNRRGGVGEMDIYMSMLDADGDWGAPINLGDHINTNLNEDTPFETTDGKRLYFSSQGHPENMGGYDIFYVNIREDGTFGIPVHVGYPLNTPGDDLFYQPINEKTGYATIHSNETGEGQEDIYMIQILEEEEIIVEEQEVEIEEEKEEQIAQIIEPETENVVEENEEQITQKVKPETEEMEAVVEEFVTQESPEAGSELKIEVSPIYYAFDGETLKNTAKNKLDIIVELLNNYSDIKLKIIGYADGFGDPNYNVVLSRKRAETAKKYLVEDKGVKSDRIAVEGKGSVNQLVIERDSQGTLIWSQSQYNRRSEFAFKNVPDNIIIITIYDVPKQLLNPEHKKE